MASLNTWLFNPNKLTELKHKFINMDSEILNYYYQSN